MCSVLLLCVTSDYLLCVTSDYLTLSIKKTQKTQKRIIPGRETGNGNQVSVLYFDEPFCASAGVFVSYLLLSSLLLSSLLFSLLKPGLSLA